MNMMEAKESRARHWLSYRSELKVLDCTIRDGGLMNDHHFKDETVRAVYRACVDAVIDYMEIGYKNSKRTFPKEKFGPWRHCDEADLRRVVGDHDPVKTGLKLAAMADAGKSDWEEDLLPAADGARQRRELHGRGLHRRAHIPDNARAVLESGTTLKRSISTLLASSPDESGAGRGARATPPRSNRVGLVLPGF